MPDGWFRSVSQEHDQGFAGSAQEDANDRITIAVMPAKARAYPQSISLAIATRPLRKRVSRMVLQLAVVNDWLRNFSAMVLVPATRFQAQVAGSGQTPALSPGSGRSGWPP